MPGRTWEIVLRGLRQEHAAVPEEDGTPAAIPADQLLRHELHNGPWLLDARYAGRPLNGRALRPGHAAVSVIQHRHVWKGTRHVGGCGGFRAGGAGL